MLLTCTEKSCPAVLLEFRSVWITIREFVDHWISKRINKFS